jgi:hypothetical protein
MSKKILFLLLLLVYNYSYSQPPAPGSDTPGAYQTPIDDYSIYLIGIALMVGVGYFIINKYKKSLI